ncbi:MAG TPA: hypothetical protein VJK03_02950 [Candidatus Nanoarchaeia archaeon]|nr:hypothetical protein [Candidatus Nanoarchaeia archaeon]
MILSYKHKKIPINAKSISFLRKFSGLMFRTRSTENLLFDFSANTKTPIHSFFVFFPFLAIWLDAENRVIECRIVKPFSTAIRPGRAYRKLIELPFNDANAAIIELLVGEERFK